MSTLSIASASLTLFASFASAVFPVYLSPDQEIVLPSSSSASNLWIRGHMRSGLRFMIRLVHHFVGLERRDAVGEEVDVKGRGRTVRKETVDCG